MTNDFKRRVKVLVVDDDKVALEVARERLEGVGFEVLTRDNAYGTTVVIMKEKPDIVLLDVNMPGLPGDELAKVVAERRLRTSVIFYSAAAIAGLRQLAEQCGAIGVIEKTDDDQKFIAQFEECLKARRMGSTGERRH